MPKFDAIITGVDGNAFVVMGRTTKAMKSAGATKADVDEYIAAATSGDYNNLLRVTMEYVDIIFHDDDDEEMCDYCGDTMMWCQCEYV
jgi:hypothetical protein